MKKLVFRTVIGALSVMLAATLSFAVGEIDATPSPTKTTAKKQRKKSSASSQELVDINTATADQLKALPGLSNDDVNKIIAGRPYARKNQLKQKNIITATAYEGIKLQIVAKKVIKQ